MRWRKWKVLWIIVLFVAMLSFELPRVQASVDYLDNNPNYPLIYCHANYREYLDLTSCNMYEADGYCYYGAGYVAYIEGYGESRPVVSREYKVRRYRQSLDGGSSLEVYIQDRNKWEWIPSYRSDEILEYIRQYGHYGFREHYLPFSYYMFKAIYKQIYGVEYPDGTNGYTY